MPISPVIEEVAKTRELIAYFRYRFGDPIPEQGHCANVGWSRRGVT